jgi:ribosomal protein S18 acetylase RimI-like enzyme
MMDLPWDADGIRYSICRRADVPAVGRLLAETFTRRDPPAIAVGLTPVEFEAFVEVILRSEATQALTIVGRHLESGGLVGVMLSEDAASPPPEGMSGLSALSERFDPIFDLFGRLDEQVDHPPVTRSGEVLHLFLLGVDGSFAGRGIAQRLVQASLALGTAQGYRAARVEATNPTSQHIFRKLGFSVIAQVSYAEYRRDGIAVFASIAEQGGPMAMIRDLGPAPG